MTFANWVILCSPHVMKPQRIIINVSGMYFETYKKTLERFPNTLLGSMKSRKYYYDEIRQEYYFDRNRLVFDAVLFYYQSNGILYRPPDVAETIFIEELDFFQINDSREKNVDLENAHRFIAGKELPLPEKQAQRKIWELFSNPSSSGFAGIIEVISILTLLSSVTLSCIETMPSIRKDLQDKNKSLSKFFQIFNHVCYAWFILEYLVRLISTADKIRYLKTFDSLVDLFAILPFYTQLFLMKNNTSMLKLSIIRFFRILRVARVLKITRYFRGMRALTYTLYASWHDLQIFLTVAMMFITVNSAITFHFERGRPGNLITSIPEALWWSINTFTTVGYGDIYPMTAWGKVMGAACSLVGIIFLGLPVYCLVNNFLTFWDAMKEMHHNTTLVKRFRKSIRRLSRLKHALNGHSN